MTRRIIDVSHFEDPIDFKKVADAGIVAIIAKATEGLTFVDPAYLKFKRAAARYNFLWGSYHFGNNGDPEAQVENYFSIAEPDDAELICLDFEQSSRGESMKLQHARQFVSLIADRTGRYPVLYGGGWLKEQLNGTPDELLSNCPLWIAQYAAKPVLPAGWKNYALWQYTDGENGPKPHEVNGVGPCDRNQFNGTIAQLRKQWPFTRGTKIWLSGKHAPLP